MTSPQVQSQTVLLVDDDPDFVAIATIALEGVGYRVVVAHSVAEGLAVAAAEQPAAAVLDLMMEQTDAGVRLAHQLRRQPATRAMPIAILTGVRQATGLDFAPTDREDFAWVGADIWVEKPVTPAELVSLVGRMLQTPPPREAPA